MSSVRERKEQAFQRERFYQKIREDWGAHLRASELHSGDGEVQQSRRSQRWKQKRIKARNKRPHNPKGSTAGSRYANGRRRSQGVAEVKGKHRRTPSLKSTKTVYLSSHSFAAAHNRALDT